MNTPQFVIRKGYTTIEAVVKNKQGIHARPSALLHTRQIEYQPRSITIERVGTNEEYECTTLNLLTANIRYNAKVRIVVEGVDETAKEACRKLYEIINSTEEEMDKRVAENNARKSQNQPNTTPVYSHK
jgi:phosphotransferase system HPr (HPr) family protein